MSEESEKPDDLADIIREKREMAAEIRAHLSIVPARREEQLLEADSLDREADRLDAAAKREHLSRRAIKVPIEVEVLLTGNAAAMREALVSVHALIADEPDGTPMIDAMKATIEAALSAPPRNCDKMPDIDNLTMHDLAKSPCKSTLEYASREELLALVRWLLAPAAEREGDGDGSK